MSERLQVSSNSKSTRLFFTSILSISISFDVKLANGKSTRHPDANRFIDAICERLHQAIEIYEKMPLSRIKFRSFSFSISILFLANVSNQAAGNELEARKAFNFIESGIEIQILMIKTCNI